MTDNLILILEQAKQIQWLAQVELQKGVCQCKQLDLEDIMVRLFTIAHTFEEELQEKEDAILSLKRENKKSTSELMQTIHQLKLQNSILQFNSVPKLHKENKQTASASKENVDKMQAFHFAYGNSVLNKLKKKSTFLQSFSVQQMHDIEFQCKSGQKSSIQHKLHYHISSERKTAQFLDIASPRYNLQVNSLTEVKVNQFLSLK